MNERALLTAVVALAVAGCADDDDSRTKVEDSAIRGTWALASFSNGEVVELSWVNGYAAGGVWWVHKVRGRPKLEDVDREAGVRFALDGRVLSVRLLASATRKTRHRVSGERIRATCGEGFASSPGPGPLPDPVQTRTRLWPAARARLRFRLPADISHIATWCRLEDPVVGHVAFVKFR